MPTPEAAPHEYVMEERLVARTAATTATTTLSEVREDGTITKVTFLPDAAATGATATKRTYTLTNKLQDGTGTTTLATFDGITSADLVASDAKDFTLTATVADLKVTAGDVLALVETVTSTGTANPGGHLRVHIARR